MPARTKAKAAIGGPSRTLTECSVKREREGSSERLPEQKTERKGKRKADKYLDQPDVDDLSRPRIKLPHNMIFSGVDTLYTSGDRREGVFQAQGSSSTSGIAEGRKRPSSSASEDTDFELDAAEEASGDDVHVTTRASDRNSKVMMSAHRKRNMPKTRTEQPYNYSDNAPVHRTSPSRQYRSNGIRSSVEVPTWFSEHEEEADTDDNSSGTESEQDVPYGGYLHGADAQQDDRIPGEEDERRFQAALDAAAAVVQDNLEYHPPTDVVSLDSGSETPSAIPDRQLQQDFPLNGYIHPAIRGLRDSLATPVLDTRLRGHDPRSRQASEDFTNASKDGNTIHSERQLGRSVSVMSGLPDGSYSNIQAIRFGQDWEIKTWYQAPYPEEFAQVAEGRIWLCEFCLKYFASHFQESRHRVSMNLVSPLSILTLHRLLQCPA